MPEQTGLLLPVVGAAGGGLTATTVVPAALVQPKALAVTEYVPASLKVETAIEGLCEVEVKLFGPVHEYVVPVAVAVRFIVPPKHIGLLLPAIGVAGVGFTVTNCVAVLEHPVAELVPVTV